MGVPPSLLSSRWLPKQQRPCLRLLLAWEDLEAALPPLSTRCLQVLLPPQPVGQTTRPITSVPASTTMVMVGCVHRCGKLSGSLLCFTGAPSHPSLYFTLRRLSVWSTVSFPSSRGSVAPVARPAAPAGQCRAASSRSGQPARHVSCEWYKPYLSYEYRFLPVSVTWNKSLSLFDLIQDVLSMLDQPANFNSDDFEIPIYPPFNEWPGQYFSAALTPFVFLTVSIYLALLLLFSSCSWE